jgi:hypothetical protein
MKINLPQDYNVHKIGNAKAYTIGADKFEKLIVYMTPKFTWVHKNFKTISKKRKRKRNIMSHD